MPTPRPNPKLMVLGDSLAQGTRSLTVSPTFVEQSYGKMIADHKGWDFVVPDLPRPILFDLEKIVSKIDIVSGLFQIPGILRRIDRNIQQWNDDYNNGITRSQYECFDNIAIAGATLQHTLGFSSADAAAQIDTLPNTMLGVLQKEKMGDLHEFINTRFCLNPSGKSTYKNWTALDWVRRRKPENLIVHAGHNNGLYPIGSEGKTPVPSLTKGTLSHYLKLIEKLAALPSAIKTIVVVLLPRVSAVANLMPVENEGRWSGDSHYYKTYKTVFPIGGKRITGATLAAFDREIVAINIRIQEKMKELSPGGRIRILDTFEVFKKYDYKNTGDASRQIPIGSRRIDNRYVEAELKEYYPGPQPLYKTVWKEGGMLSIDGMHLSAVGYAVLAKEIMKVMGLTYDRTRLLKTALKNEKLITRYPSGLRDLLALLRTNPKPVVDPQRLEKDKLRATEIVDILGRAMSKT